MHATTVERSITLNAPREKVWDAITNLEQLAGWFVPNLPGMPMSQDESGKVTLHLGEMGIELMVMEVIEPNRKVTCRSFPDDLLAVTWTLDDQGSGTRVTVTLAGLEALPENARQDRLNLTGDAWDKTLKNLKAYIEGAELPFPTAYVAPLFGFWREPKKTLGIERSIWIKASRERVWKAVTDPKQIQAWFSPNTEWHLSALELGGRYYTLDAETNAENYAETIELLDPPNQMVTRSMPVPPETAPKDRTYILTEENGGTRLTLIYTGYEPEADEIRWNNMEQNTFGFTMMLQNLKAYIDGQPLPAPGGF